MTNPTAKEMFDRGYNALQQVSQLYEALTALNIADADHLEDWDVEISDEDQIALLRSLTGWIVRLRTNLSCYPVGLVTTVLFDENGDPV